MEFEIGMYVRTKNCGIFKILKITKEKDKLWFLRKSGYQVFISDQNNPIENEIIKTSHDIIDLIEVGDFIEYKQSNMYWNIPTRVSGRYNRQQELIELMVGETPLKNVEITSVLTREEYESRKYEVNKDE